MRVLVLGAGFGGLELTARLSEELGDEVEVVLIDRADGFVFGFSKLDVMFGRTVAAAVHHPYRDVVKPGVRFVETTVRAIDPSARGVETDAGRFDADVLVVALGADLDPAATPGLVEGGHEFYTVAGAFAARDVLENFGGGRVIVGVTSTPFKCPPAPSETALLMHDYLTERGHESARRCRWSCRCRFRSRRRRPRRRRCSLPSPNAASPDIPAGASARSTRTGKRSCSPTATSCPTTSSSACPCIRLLQSCRSRDCASTVGYVEFGHDHVARVDVTFRSGERPRGQFDAPSAIYAADKSEFGSSRIRRWFGRDWNTL